MSDRPILVTGAAGFIGYHCCERLVAEGRRVVGVDNLNGYYDPALKQARLDRLTAKGVEVQIGELADRSLVEALFDRHAPGIVLHLAAQAGVRYSLENPRAYIASNIDAFMNMLEACRHGEVEHLVYASSSSVYGANETFPFAENQNVDHPLSLYAATKKSNELMAHTYSHLYAIPTTGLRFFTVYGPWGRPDMALFLFTRAILAGRPIRLFNEGKMRRDFTYIDDIVEGVARVLNHIPSADPTWTGADPDPSRSRAPWRIYNIGNNKPQDLMRYVEVLEEALGETAKKEYLPMQPGDVAATAADITALYEAVGFVPQTPIEIGIPRFVEWYREYHRES